MPNKYTDEEIKLLDEFAGRAMQGLAYGPCNPILPEDYEYLAGKSYTAASAMLEERKKYLTEK